MRSSFLGLRQLWFCIVFAAAAHVPHFAHAEARIGTGWELQCIRAGIAVVDHVQDSTGLLWIGMQSGLTSWDGIEFGWQNNLLATVPSSGLRLALEADDTLWIAPGLGVLRPTGNGTGLQVVERGHPGLERIKSGTHTLFGPEHGLPSAHVWAVHVDRKGTVWAGTEGGLARLEGGKFVSPVRATALPSSHVIALASDAQNDLWIGTTTGLARLRGNQINVVSGAEAVTSFAIDDGRGVVWAATPKGVVAIKNLAVDPTFSIAKDLPTRAATALLVDRKRRLWVASASGLTLFDVDNNKPLEIFGAGEGLPDSRTASLFEDREGGIWVGTRTGGTCRVTAKSVWDLDLANGIAPETTYAVLRAQDSAMWISSTSQIASFRNGQLEQRWKPTSNGVGELRALALAPDGSVWVTTTSAKLLHIPKRARPPLQGDLLLVDLPEKDFPHGQRAILFDAQQRMWLGRAGGGLLYAQMGTDLSSSASWHRLEDKGICQGEVTAGFMSGDKKTLWFGTEGGGATRWDGSRGRCFTREDGLGTNFVTSFAEDPTNGAIWMGSRNDAGIARYHNGKISRVRGDQGFLLSDSIAGLFIDDDAKLWTMCGIGVGRSKLSDLNAVADGKSEFAMTVIDSTRRSWETTVGTSPTGAMDESGRLWWATLRGVTVIQPETLSGPVSRTPRVRVAIGGVMVEQSNPSASQSGESHVKFHLSTATFLPFYRSVFRHRLEPLEKEWSYHLGDHAEYPKLAIGNYRLYVGVSDGMGGWSDRETTLDLHIQSPFYRTVWFSITLFAGVALAAFVVMKAREKALQLRHARTNAERTRIARDLHDVIGQAFAGIGLLLDAIRTTRATTVEPIKEMANRARAVLDHCEGDIRNTIWELREPIGDGVPLAGLAAKIVNETRHSIGEAGPTISFEATPAKLTVPQLVRQELPHVLREALSNAIKHAQAQTVLVSLSHDLKEVVLIIEDDGRGISNGSQAAAGGAHFGLLGMQERTRRMRGKLWFEPRPGGGTVVRLHVPLHPGGLDQDDS